MVSEAEIDRLRLEADTILTRYGRVERALEQARGESGDHWETGTLTVTVETPQGEPIDLTLDLDADPATNAQSRYERAERLEAKLTRRQRVNEQLSPLPADPVAYLVCYHLDAVEGNYPRSMAGHLDAQRSHVADLCAEMETAGLLERVESGTVKQRRVKAKQTDEVRQHHTYYRLSREGDHLLRFLAEPAGQLNVLRHLPDGHTVVARLAREGPDTPRSTADRLEMPFEHVRHLCRALRQVSLVVESNGGKKGGPQSPGTDSATDGTCYAVTERGNAVLDSIG